MRSPRLALLTFVAVVGAARAQEARPLLASFQTELVLETDGRTGECDMMLFTPDGKHLLSCGDDKVVRSWGWDGKSLTNERHATLRWSIYRERRGNIYAFALSPDATKVAIGGLGQRDGAAAVLDRATGNVLYGVTPRLTKNIVQRTIWSIAMSPSADRVVYGTEGGHVWAWDLKAEKLRRLGSHAEATVRRGFHVPDPGKAVLVQPVRFVTFLDENRVLSVGQDGNVFEWQWAQEGEPILRTQFRKVSDLVHVAYDRVHQRLAACGEGNLETIGNVEVRSIDGSFSRTLAVRQFDGCRNYPRHLAFDAAGERIAVGTYQLSTNANAKKFYNLTGGYVGVFDLSRPSNPNESTRCDIIDQLDYNVIALTWHPTQNVLAVVGGNNHDAHIYQLGTPARKVATMTGPGECIWEVGLSLVKGYDDKDRGEPRNLYQIGFKTKRESVPVHPNHRAKAGEPTVFDLGDRHWATPNETAAYRPQVALDSCNGWRYEADAGNARTPADATLWYAVSPAGSKVELRLERDDGYPRCYTFIPGPAGTAPRIAVGHFWGFSIFALGPNGAKLVRKCVGHQGEVMAIAPSSDFKLLVTASRDQTICCWSLAEWPGHPELGASFRIEGDWLRITSVAPGSPAAEVFKAGDAVADMQYDRVPVTGGPAAWVEKIAQAKPGRFCAFTKHYRDGKPMDGEGVQTSMRQRPLWRFFPMKDREWILWRHSDFYYDTSTKGDYRIGWQLSREVDQKPEFFRAELFRARFHRPDMVADIIGASDKPRSDVVAIPQLRPPAVTLDLLSPPTRDADARVRVSAVRRGSGADQALKSVNLWVNDFLFQEWEATGDRLTKEIVVPRSVFRSGMNRLTAQGFSQREVRDEVTHDVRFDRPARKPNLFGLVIGVDDYSKASIDGATKIANTQVVRNLKAGLDATALKAAWEAQKGKLFENVELTLLTDANVTRDRILAAAADLRSRAGADDYVLLSLAGHGATTEDLQSQLNAGGYKFREPARPGAFIYFTHGIDLTRPLATGLDGDEIFRAVRALPSRKIVLLDACHSGSKVNPVRKLAPAGMGPVVISACEPHQSARESQVASSFYGFGGRVRGVFSISLILALDKKFAEAAKGDDPEPPVDGRLTASKLVAYLVKTVPDIANGADPNAEQHPVAFLPESEKSLPVAAR
ncbi:MAG: caspase family protein [Gemmataceae bacterium]